MTRMVFSDYVYEDIVRMLAGIEKAAAEHKDEPYYILGYLETWLPLMRSNIELHRTEESE